MCAQSVAFACTLTHSTAACTPALCFPPHLRPAHQKHAAAFVYLCVQVKGGGGDVGDGGSRAMTPTVGLSTPPFGVSRRGTYEGESGAGPDLQVGSAASAQHACMMHACTAIHASQPSGGACMYAPPRNLI